MSELRFRQIHLDFHTSPDIPGIGALFDKNAFQSALRTGHVDSITLFSKCHHGLSYHPTQVGKMHPNLKFNLLASQIAAAHEIGVATPVYLSAGVDNVVSHTHPEWRRIDSSGRYSGWEASPVKPGFHEMCFRTPYLDYLCSQIREVCRMFPDIDGIFLDIVYKKRCYCEWCQRWMKDRGLRLDSEDDVDRAALETLRHFLKEATAAARETRPDMPVFHNGGNVGPRIREWDLDRYYSHFELESLPTGGWGYDHFPMSVKYVESLGKDYLGMTGKFHGSWGEFGGFKHPNALRYECAAMLANGARCSVGDQCHPSGALDGSTYALVGKAYSEVEKKEPWCRATKVVADVGVLQECGLASSPYDRATAADTGAARMLLESHLLFDMLDTESDFSRFRVIVLPDSIRIDEALKKKLDGYLRAGGSLFLTAASGLDKERRNFLFDVGATTEGLSPFAPDYILPRGDLQPDFVSTPLFMQPTDWIPGGGASQRVSPTTGESLGDVFDPYFNRSWDHFCSHAHTPNKTEVSGFACGVKKGRVCYLAHPVFTLYARNGMVAVRDYAIKALRLLLPEPSVEVSGLPSTGRVTLRRQPSLSRAVLHLLWAPTVKRGGTWGDKDVEVIEDLVPLRGISAAVRVDSALGARRVKSIRLVPQGVDLPFKETGDGFVRFVVPEMLCHQMVEISG